jgi:hypothetical protein
MITLDRLKHLVTYDPVNGGFLWAITRQKSRRGTRVGSIDKDGYRRNRLDGHQYPEHRLVWLWHHGSIPAQLDHINRIKDDNRIENLRPCTNTQNQFNVGLPVHNTSGHRGIYFEPERDKWVAHVRFVIDGKRSRHRIGRYDTAEEAAIAYNLEVVKMFGDFANLNKIDSPLGRILGMD